MNILGLHITFGLASFVASVNVQSEVREFCQFTSFIATCEDDEVIMITSAQYGRMRTGKCISGEGYIGCAADVMGYLQGQCSGRRSCEIPIARLADVVQPCKKDFMSYLEASYNCLKVLTSSQCDLPLTQSSGHFPSLAVLEGGGGSMHCPWRIQASVGQRIRLSTALFGSAGTLDTDNNNKCLIRAVIQEGLSGTIEQPLCGFSSHGRDIFTSVGHQLQIYFIIESVHDQDIQPAFMVTYIVEGCPNVKPPTNAVMKRTGLDLVVRCNHTRETWFLTCKHNKWVGEMGNCSTPIAEEPWGMEGLLVTEIPLPHGLIIAIILGILLGVLIGFVSLGVLILYRKRRSRTIPPPPPPPNTSRSKRVHPPTTYGIYPSGGTGSHGGPRRAHVYETPRVPGDRHTTYFELDSEQHMALQAT